MIGTRLPAILVLLATTLAPPVLADDFPNGCVSCHVVLPDGMDKRLNAVLDEVGHVSIRNKVSVVPGDCIKCHRTVDGPAFSQLIHMAHVREPEKNVFVSRFGGDCRHCHAVDPATGSVSLKTGKPNW
jgi:hypothetical protein